MGIFTRRRSPKEPLAPNGAPIQCRDETERRATFSFSRERRKREGIPRVDLLAHGDAGWAHMLGLPEDDDLLAWGDLSLQWPPETNRAKTVHTAVSSDWCFMWWDAGRQLDGLILNLGAVVGLRQVEGGPHFQLDVAGAVHMGPTGQEKTGPLTVTVLVCPSYSDGQATRRSMEAVYTLATGAVAAGNLDGAWTDTE